MDEQVSQDETTFTSGGRRCAATVYRLSGEAAPRPAIIMLNGMTLTRRDTVPELARRFAAAGAVVLTFDPRSWGDSEGRPRELFSVRRQRQDLRAAVAFAGGLAGVDPERVVLWGFSIGGGLALPLAARDPGIAGVVAVAPVTDGLAAMAAPAPLGVVAQMLGRGLLETVTRRPVPMTAAGRPGETAVFDGPEFLDGFRAATAGREWTNQVSTSWLVTIAAFRPVRTVDAIGVPVLYQLSDDDGAPGGGAAETMAARTREAEVVHYASHHFAVFAPEHLGRFCADAVDFLRARAILGAAQGHPQPTRT